MCGKLIWIINRLRVMSLAEIVHRILEQISLSYLKLIYILRRSSYFKSRDPQYFSFCTSKAAQLPTLNWETELSGEEVDQCMEGKWQVLNSSWKWREDSDCWYTAPDTGKKWPHSFFNSINYRAGNPYGDIRVVWEPARLQQLVCLSLLCNQDERVNFQAIVKLIERQLQDWIDANPFLQGIHYISAMECALRIISVCTALDMVRDKLEADSSAWINLLKLVESHAYLIEKRLSLYSSKGNHTIAEAVGLLYAGILFPEFKVAVRWKRIGQNILNQEADVQILRDGGSVEQSFWYLQFVSDLYGLANMLLETQNIFDDRIQYAFSRSKNFLSCFGAEPSQLPNVGDSDSGYALSKFLRISFQGNNVSSGENILTFEDSGYTLLTVDNEINLILDHGPLGMPPSYGHGHSDALSLLLRINNNEVLTDSGCYSYSASTELRKYFRGAAAHNTVTVDNLDHATYVNGFMWRKPYQIELVHNEKISDGYLCLAKHSGYMDKGVTHWRGLYVDGVKGVLVWDCLIGSDNHNLTLRWHIDADVYKEDEGYRVKMDTPVFIKIKDERNCKLLHGAMQPIMGWKSKFYGEKYPINSIECSYDGFLPYEFQTHITWGANAALDNEKLINIVSQLRNIVNDS